MPPAAWKDIARRTWIRTWQDNVGLVAAGVTYYGFLALVPLLGIIVLLYGLIADASTVVSNVRSLTDVLPPDVAKWIAEQLIAAVQTSEQTKGFSLVAALLVALYGGTNGAGAIITAMNIAYEEKEKRTLLHFYAIAMTMTVVAVVLAIVALGATAAISYFGTGPSDASPMAVFGAKAGAYLAMTVAAAGIAASLYRYGPSRENAKWTWITPGSLFAAGSWLLLTSLFGVYVTQVTDYSATYGSLGTIIALLTWIYLSAYALIFGAELNSEIEHQTAKDSTTGPPVPLGQRGAWAADNVATSDEPDRREAPTMADATPDPPKLEDKG
ncbi:YihY/virulence factor BrkB family protein [Sphingomonas sinipercae]|nr:YihY/virulence factor BrkB family protein [Sphingomonas sinipercae]